MRSRIKILSVLAPIGELVFVAGLIKFVFSNPGFVLLGLFVWFCYTRATEKVDDERQ